MSIRTRVIGVVCAGCVAASGFYFGQRSLVNLGEVDKPLQAVASCAIKESPIDFVVVDGGRTEAEQKINVANGKSWTMRSRHLEGKAIDFAAFVNGRITYDPAQYYPIAFAFKTCSTRLNIPIIWGGDWRVKDLMHIELDRRFYP